MHLRRYCTGCQQSQAVRAGFRSFCSSENCRDKAHRSALSFSGSTLSIFYSPPVIPHGSHHFLDPMMKSNSAFSFIRFARLSWLCHSNTNFMACTPTTPSAGRIAPGALPLCYARIVNCPTRRESTTIPYRRAGPAAFFHEPQTWPAISFACAQAAQWALPMSQNKAAGRGQHGVSPACIPRRGLRYRTPRP